MIIKERSADSGSELNRTPTPITVEACLEVCDWFWENLQHLSDQQLVPDLALGDQVDRISPGFKNNTCFYFDCFYIANRKRFNRLDPAGQVVRDNQRRLQRNLILVNDQLQASVGHLQLILFELISHRRYFSHPNAVDRDAVKFFDYFFQFNRFWSHLQQTLIILADLKRPNQDVYSQEDLGQQLSLLNYNFNDETDFSPIKVSYLNQGFKTPGYGWLARARGYQSRGKRLVNDLGITAKTTSPEPETVNWRLGQLYLTNYGRLSQSERNLQAGQKEPAWYYVGHSRIEDQAAKLHNLIGKLK